MISNFACIREDIWRLANAIDGCRRRRLLQCTSYERIVERILEGATLKSHKREKLKQPGSKPSYYRVWIAVTMDLETLDLFHNSRCGYRAQYFYSVENGELANAYTLQVLAPGIRKMLSGRQKRTCPWWWVEKSLLDREAKVWIHQGSWLRQRRNSDRNLCIQRWMVNAPSARRKALWGSLIPAGESNLDIKGGYVNLQGASFGTTLKPCRGIDIHKFGFT